MAEKHTESSMLTLLRNTYPNQQYVVVPQVADQTGGGRNRIADALIFSLWPSNGLWVAGVEIKVSRSDWQRELKDFSKAECISQYCDYWYVAVPDVNMVRREELPSDWGLMVANEERIKTVIKAPKRPTVPMNPSFIASIFRSAIEHVAPRAEIEREIHKAAHQARNEGYKQGEESAKRQMQHQLQYAESLKQSVADFNERTGLNFSDYSCDNIIKGVNYVKSGGIEKDLKNLRQLQEVARKISGSIDEKIGDLESLLPEVDGSPDKMRFYEQNGVIHGNYSSE